MSETTDDVREGKVDTYVKALKPKNLGTPRAPDLGKGEKEVMLGVITGEAFGCREYVTKDNLGNELIAFPIMGDFTAYCADGSVLNSATMYLPSGFHEGMVNSLMRAEVDKEGNPTGKRVYNGSRIKFAFGIYTIADSNRAGYTYKVAAIDQSEEGPSRPAEVMARKNAAAIAKLLPLAAKHLPVAQIEGPKAKK